MIHVSSGIETGAGTVLRGGGGIRVEDVETVGGAIVGAVAASLLRMKIVQSAGIEFIDETVAAHVYAFGSRQSTKR